MSTETTQATEATSTPPVVETAGTVTTPPVENNQATTDQNVANAATTTETTNNDAGKVTAKDDQAAQKTLLELKLPENSKLDQEYLNDVKSLAEKHGLTQAQAEALIERDNQARNGLEESQATFLEKKKDEWLEAVKADADIGGDNLNRNVELASRFINEYGTQELKDELDKTGFGNHPEVVRMFVKLGKAMANDSFVKGDGQGLQPLSHADRMFGGKK